MPLGVLKVGALTLNENYKISDATNAQSGVRTVNISGIETFPGRTLAQVQAIADDLTAMFGRTVPITFSHKTDRSGYYIIEDVNTSAVHWDGHATGFNWSLGLTRIGPDNAVDIESRMTHVVRANNFSLTGERWHAPAIGHNAYYVGAVDPAIITRVGADGSVKVYRAIPAVSPRWACPVGSFTAGRARFLDSNGIERTGQDVKLGPIGWEMNNGLVRVRPSLTAGTTLAIAFWDGFAWRERDWDIQVGGVPLEPSSHFLAVSVMRADPEMVSIRVLVYRPANGARVLLDLVLRRGSRFIEGYIQRATAGSFSVNLDVAEPYTSGTGYVVATTADTNGIKLVAGSAKTFTAAANLGLSLASTLVMDFWVGAEVAAATGGGANLGFESGAFSPWTTSVGTPTIQSGGAPEGTYYARIAIGSGGTDLNVTHPNTGTVVAPATNYIISGWIRSSVATSSSQALLILDWYNVGNAIDGQSVVVAPALSANVWTFVSGTVTSSAAAVSVSRRTKIVAAAASAGTQFDIDAMYLRGPAASGDLAADLRNQYIAAASEATMVVAR